MKENEKNKKYKKKNKKIKKNVSIGGLTSPLTCVKHTQN